MTDATVFDISESTFEIGEANNNGGPYVSDANTVLLLHFNTNLNEESHSYTVNNHGIAKTYISNPVSGLNDAIYFDNSLQANDSYITVSNSASEMSLSGNWTVEFWFKFNSWGDNYNNWATPILLPTTGWDTNYYLEIPASMERLKYGFTNSSGGSQILSSSNSITTGEWYHVALINDYDNHAIKIVLHNSNFQLLEEQSANYTSGTTSTGTQDLRIGAGLFTENHFDGYMDELRISNVVRSFDALGIQESILKDKYNIYPNPTKNILNINLPEKVDLSIYTITGQKILENKNIQSGLIDVSKLKSGLYIVLFKGNKGSISKKLIIE
ncbi:MAG: T9SS type A sorting domain-containing protein [Flavobacteriaceae bacterium]